MNDVIDITGHDTSEYLQSEANNDALDGIQWHDSTYEIVSKMAYLLGVPKLCFKEDRPQTDIRIYRQMDLDKTARIIRNLCFCRTAIEKYFKVINQKIKYEFKSVSSVPEYIPTEILMQLSSDGASFVKRTDYLYESIIEINRLINDRINNCKHLLPLWLNWDYIRDLFIMPNGLTEAGTKVAAELYYNNRPKYPYQVYMNWKPVDAGNILYNDKKFVSLLYTWHQDTFSDYSKISDAGSYVKNTIYDFIKERDKLVVMVDCENADPYKVLAAFRNLDFSYTQKISKIILIDDVNTVDTWEMLGQYISIPIEHILIERVKADKSLVDIRLTTRTCEEHYKNDVDGFILISSDSDYWGLITALPNARFLVMVEREGFGFDLRYALENAGIFYCYIDDFNSGNIETLRHNALIHYIRQYLDHHLNINLQYVLDNAVNAAHVHMSDSEKKQFYAKYLKTLQFSIKENGDVAATLKNA